MALHWKFDPALQELNDWLPTLNLTGSAYDALTLIFSQTIRHEDSSDPTGRKRHCIIDNGETKFRDGRVSRLGFSKITRKSSRTGTNAMNELFEKKLIGIRYGDTDRLTMLRLMDEGQKLFAHGPREIELLIPEKYFKDLPKRAEAQPIANTKRSDRKTARLEESNPWVRAKLHHLPGASLDKLVCQLPASADHLERLIEIYGDDVVYEAALMFQNTAKFATLEVFLGDTFGPTYCKKLTDSKIDSQRQPLVQELGNLRGNLAALKDQVNNPYRTPRPEEDAAEIAALEKKLAEKELSLAAILKPVEREIDRDLDKKRRAWENELLACQERRKTHPHDRENLKQMAMLKAKLDVNNKAGP